MATPRNTKAKKISQRKKQVAEAKKMASRKAPKKTAPSKTQRFEDTLKYVATSGNKTESGKAAHATARAKVKSNRDKVRHDKVAKTEHVRKTAAAKKTVNRLTKQKKKKK